MESLNSRIGSIALYNIFSVQSIFSINFTKVQFIFKKISLSIFLKPVLSNGVMHTVNIYKLYVHKCLKNNMLRILYILFVSIFKICLNVGIFIVICKNKIPNQKNKCILYIQLHDKKMYKELNLPPHTFIVYDSLSNLWKLYERNVSLHLF